MVSIGIDPGLGGAIACVTHSGRILFADTPTLKIKVGKSIKNQIDVAAAVAILAKIKNHADNEGTSIHCAIEKVNAMPAIGGARIGVTSAFNFGMGFGIWQGILGALKIPYSMVAPVTWKKRLMPDATKDKQASILRAKQLFPQVAVQLARKKDHGRADALLICEYGRLMMEGTDAGTAKLMKQGPSRRVIP